MFINKGLRFQQLNINIHFHYLHINSYIYYFGVYIRLHSLPVNIDVSTLLQTPQPLTNILLQRCELTAIVNNNKPHIHSFTMILSPTIIFFKIKCKRYSRLRLKSSCTRRCPYNVN